MSKPKLETAETICLAIAFPEGSSASSARIEKDLAFFISPTSSFVMSLLQIFKTSFCVVLEQYIADVGAFLNISSNKLLFPHCTKYFSKACRYPELLVTSL